MAQKRMFSNSVIDTDCFLDMPATAVKLYLIFGMKADDDGFITSPKALMRLCGATQDDFEILLVKNYLIKFDSGTVLITHWKVNNSIQKDRYKPTMCEEIRLVGTKPNGEYYLLQDIEDVITDEEKTESNAIVADVDFSDCTEEENKIINEYLGNYSKLYSAKILTSRKPVVDWKKAKERLREAVNNYGYDTILKAIQKSIKNVFCIKVGYALEKIVTTSVLSELVNVNKIESTEQAEKSIEDIDKIELQNLIKKHPKKCECGYELESSSASGITWYCRNCKNEYVMKNGKWVLGE